MWAAPCSVLPAPYSLLSAPSLSAQESPPLEPMCGQAYVTRNEFTLLLLVLQGKVEEEDLRECRAAFEALDADGSGKLSQADIDLINLARDLL